MSSWPMLALLLGMMGVCARDAWRDRSPRKPWDWSTPALEWWATRRTKRERARVELSL